MEWIVVKLTDVEKPWDGEKKKEKPWKKTRYKDGFW